MYKLVLTIAILYCSISSAQVQKFENPLSNNESFGMSISPNGEELLFVRAYGGRDTLHIFKSIKVNDDWVKPTKASFSINGINQIDPSYSPDGKFILINMIMEEERGYDVFIVERTQSGLGELHSISGAINTEKHEFYATMSKNRNVYFTRRNDSNDIYISRWDGAKYLEAISLNFNTENSESNPYISPYEDFLIFTSRNEETKGVDLFVSFRKKDLWSDPINLGDPINSELNEFCPSMDLKNKLFLFSRTEVLDEKRIENMFSIPIKDLRLKKLKKQAVFSE